MALGKAKFVLDQLADVYSRKQYMVDHLTKAQFGFGQKKKGDSIDLPSVGSYTVSDAVDGNGALQDATLNAHGITAITLTLDQEPFIPVEIGYGASAQYEASGGLGSVITQQLKNEMDRRAVRNFRDVVAFTTDSKYHDNAAAAALTKKLVLDPVGKICNDGAIRENLQYWFNPSAEGELSGLESWSREAGNGSGDMGGQIGRIAGIPVMASQGLSYKRTVACTAVVIATNVATVTAADHGFAVGQKIKISGITVPLTTAAAILTVADKDTFTVDLTAQDGAMADGAGVVEAQDQEAMLIDAGNAHVAQQILPFLKLVDGGPKRASDVIKAYSLFGYKARVSSVRILHVAA